MLRNSVVAHYSEDSTFTPSFVELINILSRNMDEVIVVTTNVSLSGYEFRQNNVSVTARPNIGYDFYSYKVGLNKLTESNRVGDTFFINSSFFITDSVQFENCILQAIEHLDQSDLVGVTKSLQFSTHVQSYFLAIKEQSLEAQWCKEWFSNIEPKDSKIEVIYMYEIGLTSLFLMHGQKIFTLWNPSSYRKFLSSFTFGKQLIRTKSILFCLANINDLNKYNPVQIEAKFISENYGFIKNEILAENPLGIQTDFLGNLRSELSTHVNTFRSSPPTWDSSSIVHIQDNFPSRAEVVVTLHIHHIEILDEIYEALDNIPIPFDLWITTSIPSLSKKIFTKFQFMAVGIRISIGPNVGRDVAPFLYQVSELQGSNYKAGLKLHTKRSGYSQKGEYWRKRILGALLPSSPLINEILEKIIHGDAGIIGGSQEYITDVRHWGSNERVYLHIASKLENLKDSELNLEFFAGTMFWFKPSTFSTSSLFPYDGLFVEDGAQDGTLAHAFERVFCKVARNADLSVYGSDNLRADISTLNLKNHIPVID
jgi:rhamnosyltransferase